MTSSDRDLPTMELCGVRKTTVRQRDDIFTSNFRVRRNAAAKVREIARDAAATTNNWEIGDHRFAWTNTAWHFLDGRIVDSHEWQVGGLWVVGDQVRRFVLYEFGAVQPPCWKREERIPSHRELRDAIACGIRYRQAIPALPSSRIVVGVVNESIVVVEREERLEGLFTLFTLAGSTWRELRQRLPASVRAEVEGRFSDPDDIPGDDTLVDLIRVPGVDEGDWPWPAQDMMQWLPLAIQEEFGEVRSTRLNGDYLHVDAKQLEPLIEALERRGFACTREDEKMNRVSGY